MLRNVPTGISCFLGTMAVSMASPERRKFDVAALLAGFNETNRFKPSLDLANKDGA